MFKHIPEYIFLSASVFLRVFGGTLNSFLPRLATVVPGLILLSFINSASGQPYLPVIPIGLQPIDPGVFKSLNSATFSSKSIALAKVGGRLSQLYFDHAQYMQQGGPQAPGAFATTDPTVRLINGSVVIDAVASQNNAQSLLADLQALGLTNGVSFQRMVSGRLPISKIKALSTLTSLQFARPATMHTNSGLVASQGDHAMRADLARATFGVSGTGVTVGVLSDSYNCLGGAPADVASGDLPTNVNLLQDSCLDGTDEGRALLQIIHDVAPGAAEAFTTADGGQAAMAQGIIALQQAGAKVIADDVYYYEEPVFQDGVISQAVETVKNAGVSYFTAAGNNAKKSYQSTFHSSGVSGLNGVLHDFDPGPGISPFQTITLSTGPNIITFQWDEPYFSVSGSPGSASDYDIWVCYYPSVIYCNLGAADNNIGGDPIEFLGITYDGSLGPAVKVYLAIVKIAGPANNLLKYIDFTQGSNILNFNTQSSTIFGHANAESAATVGAAFYDKTPAFGISPPQLETFSSVGGTNVLFDTTGARIQKPEPRQKPDIVSPDGVNTTFFGIHIRAPIDGSNNNKYPNFFGTSAAVAHAAGVAALMQEYNATLTPDDTYGILKSTAINMLTNGFNYSSGFGFIQADAAVAGGIPVQFSNAGYSVNQSAGTATITVTRNLGIYKPVTVQYATSNGSATAGVDYKASSGLLSFAAGETRKTFTIPILVNTRQAPNQTVNLMLSNPLDGAILGNPGKATLTIINNHMAGNVQFSSAAYSVNEVSPSVTITVTRTGGNASGASVNYATSNGTATAGVDYKATSGTLTFGTGVNSKTFTIPLINNPLHEPNQTINLTLSNPVGGAKLGTPNPATLTIINNHPAGNVQFSAANYSVSEAGHFAKITITRSGGNASGVSVDYASSDGTAAAGVDYTAVSGTLTFGVGVSSKTFTIPIIEETLREPNENLSLTLSNPSGGAKLGTVNRATLTIIDNHPRGSH